MKYRRVILASLVMICFWVGNSGTFAADIIWQNSKDTAVSMAISQGKKILFVGGRETCGNCQYMKYTACESTSPPIKTLIEQYFIPWFCDVDNSTEWYPYAVGLGGFTLPLICVIDPNGDNTYQDRTTGIQDLQEFYSRLLQYTSIQVLIGDINKSGKVDLVDGILSLQIFTNFSTTVTDISADVNNDHKIGLAEAIYALQVVAGLRK